MIVAASVVVGARVLATADDSVQVWTVAGDVGVGERLAGDDLVARRVRFAEEADLDRYLLVEEELPADLTVIRPLGAGELLPRGAVGSGEDAGTVTISLAVDPALVPSGVDSGSVVDVYVLGLRRGGANGGDDGGPALDGVSVVAAPPVEEALTTSGQRQVELAVPDEDVAAFYTLLDSFDQPTVSVAQDP